MGLILAKPGLAGDFDPFRATAIRTLAAVIAIWLLTFVQRQAGATLDALRHKPQAIRLLALGAFTGPLLGVSASLLAVQHTNIGVASTLMALSPVIVLPISYWVLKEKIVLTAMAGTLLAFAGVAILFLA